jgi:hypothetical protein
MGERKVLGRLLHALHSLCSEGVDAYLLTFALAYREGQDNLFYSRVVVCPGAYILIFYKEDIGDVERQL